MRRNLNRVRDYLEYTISAYLPDEFKSHFRTTRETCELFLILTISAVILAILREQSCSSKSCKLSVGNKHAGY